jgi:hypothetical protein
MKIEKPNNEVKRPRIIKKQEVLMIYTTANDQQVQQGKKKFGNRVNGNRRRNQEGQQHQARYH